MKVVITESLSIGSEIIDDFRQKLISLGCSLEVYEDKANDSVLIDRIKEADIAIIANHPLRESVLKEARNLKLIDVAFTGLDHVDVDYARQNNIAVLNAAGYSDISVSELVIGLTIGIYRDLIKADTKLRAMSDKTGLHAREIRGKRVGIVGTGNIGTATAKLFHAFGAEVYGYSRTKRDEFKQYGKYVELEKLFELSDIISIHLPLNKETRGMIDQSYISMMKEDAILINCARGAIVVRSDLSEALKNKSILGAGIDVFDIEPPLNDDCPYIDCDNAILTPHIAFYTNESMKRRAKIVFDNAIDFIKENIKSR